MIVLSFGMTSVMNGAGYIRYVLCSVGILTKDEEQDNGFLLSVVYLFYCKLNDIDVLNKITKRRIA
jgi:hypothetical protein